MCPSTPDCQRYKASKKWNSWRCAEACLNNLATSLLVTVNSECFCSLLGVGRCENIAIYTWCNRVHMMWCSMLWFAMLALLVCIGAWIVRMFIVIMTIMIMMLMNVLMRLKERQRRTNYIIVLCSFCLVFCNVCSPQISSFKVRAEEIWPIPWKIAWKAFKLHSK